MKKSEIELIVLKVTADGQEAISMKIYKNGTTCRSGVGGLPQLGISGMSFVDDSRYFEPLIEKVPQEVLDNPINYEEETPNGYLEYVIAFFGDSKNGETGERADWSKSTGIRAKVDHQTTFNHPIMGLLDGLTMDAAESTNELYFDVIMLAKWGAKSSTLPQTIIGQPKTEQEIHVDYDNYVNQMTYSARKWNMSPFVENKIYEKEGIEHIATITNSENQFSITFSPIGGSNDSKIKPNKKKPWWKF